MISLIDERNRHRMPPPLRVARSTVPERRHAIPRFRLWVRMVDQIHGCAWSASSVAADAIVLSLCGVAAGLRPATLVAMVIALLVSFNLAGVYGHRSTLETQGVLWYPTKVGSPFAVVVLAGVAISRQLDDGSGTHLLRFAVLAAAGLFALRLTTWGLLSTVRRAGKGLRRTLVVGSGEAARTLVKKLAAYPEAGLKPVGIVSPDGNREHGEGLGTGALPADLPSIIRHRGITHVVLVPEGNHDVGVAESLELCDGLDVSFSMLPPLADLFLHPGLVSQVGGVPLIVLGKVARSRSTLPGKRAFDVAVASALLFLALPVIAATAAAIRLSDRGPLLYRQRRVGQGGREFWMLKFRSMVVGADQQLSELSQHNVTDGLLFKMHNDPRVTSVGKWIRRLSIDELPQLWNVIRGEMSMVGPRPLPVDPDDFGALDGKRHSVPPGITGYWQIAGGTGLTYQEMVKLDLSYIQNWSLWLDLRLLLRTFPALVSRQRQGPT